jgi:hypothetical protein
MGDITYRFKPSNWNLDEYIKSRQFAANQLRTDAATLKFKADAIEDELIELQKRLVEDVKA